MKCSDRGAGEKGRSHRVSKILDQPSTPLLLIALLSFIVISCGTSLKARKLKNSEIAATISLPEDNKRQDENSFSLPTQRRDTLKVTDLDGKEMLIMRAVKDEATGEMVAVDQIDAAIVTTRFRNIAERFGKVDLEFSVIVPSSIQDSRWQLRLHPDMFILNDSIRLEDVLLTGKQYRNAQLRGYEMYQKFLSRIVEDSLEFVDLRNFELFIERNIPSLYAFRQDSSFVSDQEFESSFGVTSREAFEHYTNRLLEMRNDRLISLREKRWHRYVKSPIVKEGVKLDTVIRNLDGDFIYNYVKTIRTRPNLRNVSICLSGEIFEQDRRIFTIQRTEPLTFYISSVSYFADTSSRYLTKVISRNAESNLLSRIDFKKGRADIDENLSNNRIEVHRIKKTLYSLLTNDSYQMDSIVIIATASPEGGLKQNLSLTYKRAESASKYFEDYIEYMKDSISRSEGLFITVGEEMKEGNMAAKERSNAGINFLSRSGGENWTVLNELVESDTLITQNEKDAFKNLMTYSDLDARESDMKKSKYYKYIKDRYYPNLRTVSFNFYLHRKGMIKDTIHTTVLDSTYMEGVRALSNHDYEKAVNILMPYQDYNSAVAYVALGRDKSALAILEKYPKTAQVNYLLALLYSREGNMQAAIEHYIHACRQNRSYVYRGNLDPEISALVKEYGLKLESEDDTYN